jgi:hypothetical protein
LVATTTATVTITSSSTLLEIGLEKG